MSSVVHAHESGDQVFLERESWLSQQSQAWLAEAVENPKIGPERTLAIILHHGLGLPLELVARLTKTTKNTVAKQVISGTKRLAKKEPRDDDLVGGPITVAKWLERYLENCRDLSKDTRNLYRSVADRLTHLFGRKPVSEVDEDDVEQFLELLDREQISAATKATLTSAARSIFRGACRSGAISNNPFQPLGRLGEKRKAGKQARIASATA